MEDDSSKNRIKVAVEMLPHSHSLGKLALKSIMEKICTDSAATSDLIKEKEEIH